jgi:hypothetical protein
MFPRHVCCEVISVGSGGYIIALCTSTVAVISDSDLFVARFPPIVTSPRQKFHAGSVMCIYIYIYIYIYVCVCVCVCVCVYNILDLNNNSGGDAGFQV